MSPGFDPALLAHLPPELAAEAMRLLETLTGRERLEAFIRRLTPSRPPQRHMMPIIRAVERARHRPIRLCITMPPRHGKTVTINNSIAWWLAQSPGDTCGYFTYNEAKGRSKSRAIRALALQAGVVLADDAANLAEWRTTAGGGLLAGGAGGGLTGSGIAGGLMVVDDPYKGPGDVNSTVMRERVQEWFQDVVFTRLEDASCIVIHTRWREDDLIGWLTSEHGWELINLPAVAEEGDALGRAAGEPLWPARWGLEKLGEIERTSGPYTWSALYQQRPRKKGAAVFRGQGGRYDPEAWTDLTGWQMTLFVDPAASESTTADYSVALALATKGEGAAMRGRIVEVMREQEEVPTFTDRLPGFRRRNWDGRLGVEAVGAFKVVGQLLRRLSPGLAVEDVRPLGDKFMRAQPVAAAWNDGRIELPIGASWIPEFLAEVGEFTGVNDEHDDQVDALSGAWNLAQTPRRAAPVVRIKSTAPARKPQSTSEETAGIREAFAQLRRR